MKKTILFFSMAVLCLSATNKAHGQKINGNDFWFVFNQNDQAVGVGGTISNSPLTFIIISVHKVNGTITAPRLIDPSTGNPWTTTFTVAAGGQTAVSIPYSNSNQTENFYTDAFNSLSDKGFEIVTDSMATVYAVSNSSASVDGEVVLPVTMLDKSYVVASRSTNQSDLAYPAVFTVGAIQNNTQVTIKSWNASGDVTLNLTLDKGQTYTYSPSGDGVSSYLNTANQFNITTGSTVTANKSVYVVGQSQCSRMIDCGACDVMMTELRPVSLWGTRYILAQPIKRNPITCSSLTASLADYVEIIGNVGQQITISNWSGATTKTIPALPFTTSVTPYSFLWYDNPYNPSLTSPETNGEANLILTSTQPFGVVQYQKDYGTDNLAYTDPEATVCYPESMWTNNYLAGTVASAGASSGGVSATINVIINNVGTPAPISTISIKGAGGAAVTLPATTCTGPGAAPGTNCWQPIKGGPSDNYMFYRYAVNPGTAYTISSTAGYNFGFYFATFSTAASYVVQGGGGASAPVPILLPISLLAFDASVVVNKRDVNVTWKVATESNSSIHEYVIERSENGVDFNEVSPALNPEGDNHTYNYIDKTPTAGINYYRLKIKDYSGKTDYSHVVSANINLEKVFRIATVAPNPGQGLVTVSYTSGANVNAEWQLNDVYGRMLLKGKQLSTIGDNQLNIDLSLLDKGNYFLVMRNYDEAVLPLVTKITKD